jgi:isoquinoline 1-oxidoreductase subunit beta
MTREGMDRRSFLAKGSVAGAGLVIGFTVLENARAAAPGTIKKGARGATLKDINAYVRIGTDDSITLLVPKSEMGQGVLTSMPMILADELDVDFSKVKSEHALADATKYPFQITGGSTSVRANYQTLREAGAAARLMLIAAAAETWKVPAGEIRAEKGYVYHDKTQKKVSYGSLSERAAKQKPPAKPELKPTEKLELIGKPMKRVDATVKAKGEAIFGIDVQVPGMVIARVVHPAIFGGKVKSFDAKEAKKVHGVKDVVQIPTGIAVVADNFWSAKTGADQLDVQWDDAGNKDLSNAKIDELFKSIVEKGIDARKDGDPAGVIAKAQKKLSAVYELPYLAHATMEPVNATADVRADRCEIWAPTQGQMLVHQAAAQITGLPLEKITVHTTFLGGGFGRKANVDFVADAIHLSKALKKPVKVVWAREDDMRGGQYRPAAYNHLEGSLDAQGMPNAWIHKIASPSIMDGFKTFGGLKNGIDPTSVEGAANLPYSIAHQHITYAKADLPIPVWFWRSVGSSLNGFITEHFLDELAALGGKDPFELRRQLLSKSPRHKRALEAVADKAGWGKPVAKGRGRGIAVHESFGSIVAEVAEVSMDGGRVRVHKVWCAVDCGQVVNPSTILAQMESGIVYGLSAALYGKIDIANGSAVQGNFDSYNVLRMAEMPEVETTIIATGDPWGGIGEVATPPIAGAVANAILSLTKKPVRKLPIQPT